MQKRESDRQLACFSMVAFLLVTLFFTLPSERATADRRGNNRGNRNNRNRQQAAAQAAAKARARAAAEVKKLTAQLQVVNFQLNAVNQQLIATETQLRAAHEIVGQMRQHSDSAAAEAFEAKNEVLEIEKQLAEEESPGSKLGQAQTTFEREKVAYEKVRKELGAKLDRNISATERDKQVDADLIVVFKRKVMFESHVQLEKVREEVFTKSPDWRNAREILQESSSEAGTAKRNLNTQISGYNKIRHVVLVTRKNAVALLATKRGLESKKAAAQKQTRGGSNSSKNRNSSGKKK